MNLYQREECPACTRIRTQLAQLGLSYEVHNVSRVGKLRDEVLALAGVTSPEVPVLVDGEQVLQGSEQILPFLAERYGGGRYGEPVYGLTRTLADLTFADAISATREALASEGFGVLTEINVKETLKKKLDVDFRNYVILGACNPALAHQALTAEPAIGLLLPCNVVVTEDPDGKVVVSAIDPRRMFSVIDRPDVEPLAVAVKDKLVAVLAKI